MSFFEQAVEGPARIILGTSGARSSARRLRCEEIAEVCFLSICNPLGVRLSAAITECWLVVGAINARVKIGTAPVTFIGPANKSLDLNLGATMMTVHSLQLLDADPMLFQYFTRIRSKNKVEFVLAGWVPLFPLGTLL